MSYLERSQNEIKNEPQFGLHLLRDEGKHDEVDPKQRYEEQRRLCQSPERAKKKTKTNVFPSHTSSINICLELRVDQDGHYFRILERKTSENFRLWSNPQEKTN